MTKRMPAAWNERVRTLFTVFGEENLRAVGGCVRDALLGLPVKDIDFATTHTPDDMTELLEKSGIKVKPTGIEHGTVTALVNGHAFEITTMRKDVETHGRRAVVAFTKDKGEDAQRRDFTINALYADVAGNIEDPTGQGLADLEGRTLRFIGDASMRIAEDYLRILRLFRFAAQLPDFTIDAEALKAAAAQKDSLSKLSRERVTSEWLKLLAGVYAPYALSKASEAGLDSLYKYGSDAPSLLRALPRAYLLAFNPSPLVLALAFPDGLPESFLLSNADKRHYEAILKFGPSDTSWQEIAYRQGLDLARYIGLWRSVMSKKPLSEEAWREIDTYIKPIFPLKAADFQAKGLEGPALGKAFKEAEEAWILRMFRN